MTSISIFMRRSCRPATIIVAVLSLVDLSILKKTWGYARADFAAVAATILLTLHRNDMMG